MKACEHFFTAKTKKQKPMACQKDVLNVGLFQVRIEKALYFFTKL